MAATVYAISIRCLSGAIRSATLIGCAAGAGWTLFVIIAGNTFAQLNGATPLTLDRIIRQVIFIPTVLVPLGVVL